jgi:hypothetical protein
MKYIISFLLLISMSPVYCTNYSCDVFKNSQQITTLPGSLPDNNSIALATNKTPLDPNIALAYTLCQQAGFKLINTQASIPGLRSGPSVTKIQQFPDPACSLKCSVVAINS